MFWKIIELMLLVILLTFFVTQLIIPLWRDLPLLPAFRHDQVDDLEAKVKEDLDEERRLHEVLEKKKELDHLASENLKSRLDSEDL